MVTYKAQPGKDSPIQNIMDCMMECKAVRLQQVQLVIGSGWALGMQWYLLPVCLCIQLNLGLGKVQVWVVCIGR